MTVLMNCMAGPMWVKGVSAAQARKTALRFLERVRNLLLIAIIRSIERYLMRHEAQVRQGVSTPRVDGSAVV